MTVFGMLERKENLTPIETIIADYILGHWREIGAMTLSELSNATYSSNAAVSRFCQKLGFKGYRDFHVALISEAEKRRRNGRMVDPNRPFQEDESAERIVTNTADLMKGAIDACHASISLRALQKAADWISEARCLYIYGAGDSMISAMGFANQIAKLGIPIIQPMQFNESIAISATANHQDVALLLSYSGRVLTALQREMTILRNAGCKMIVVTTDTARQDADLTINFPNKEGLAGKISVFYSQASYQYILNCIYALVFSKNYQENMERKSVYDNMAFPGLE